MDPLAESCYCDGDIGCRECGGTGYRLTREGWQLQMFAVGLLGNREFRDKAFKFVEDMMAELATFGSQVRRAIKIKLDPTSQSSSPRRRRVLAALLGQAEYGADAVLRELLNSSVAGPGAQGLESGLVAQASSEEKAEAVDGLIDALCVLELAGEQSGEIASLIGRLREASREYVRV